MNCLNYLKSLRSINYFINFDCVGVKPRKCLKQLRQLIQLGSGHA